jgi:hypothetical protein
VDTVEGLRDAARQARECAVMGDAVTLARWIGTSRRPVTPGRVLRKADVSAAGAALGVEVPARLRTMAGFGASWEHEITLEKTLRRDHSMDYPVCVAFRGDSPVEYWSEEEPEEPSPFGLNEVNRRLAALGREPA